MTTQVTLSFRLENEFTMEMETIPRVGDRVNDETVTGVDWYISRNRADDDTPPTCYVIVSFEESE